ncbi:variant sh3 domain containing protein [Anaeramoeba flamelloides]|uniref:Variant sh3 domain containing protein n=1 Tax=Anaeramoeba flamelloides TaxID=1746091 RepID=A0AAV7ZYF9_9EUKA|nr:variant sh3 domain containing protein [Anaeramoeba flamelloides]
MTNSETGWLYKKHFGRYFSRWKLKWVLLRSHYLFIFEDDESSTSETFIDLHQVTTIKTNTKVSFRYKKLCFQICTLKKNYLFRATSKQYVNYWKNIFEKQIKLTIGDKKDQVALKGNLEQLVKGSFKKKFIYQKCKILKRVHVLVHYDIKKLDFEEKENGNESDNENENENKNKNKYKRDKEKEKVKEKENEKKTITMIHLDTVAECTKVKSNKKRRKNIFQIKAIDRNYFFRASSQNQCDEWIEAIQSMLKRHKPSLEINGTSIKYESNLPYSPRSGYKEMKTILRETTLSFSGRKISDVVRVTLSIPSKNWQIEGVELLGLLTVCDNMKKQKDRFPKGVQYDKLTATLAGDEKNFVRPCILKNGKYLNQYKLKDGNVIELLNKFYLNQLGLEMPFLIKVRIPRLNFSKGILLTQDLLVVDVKKILVKKKLLPLNEKANSFSLYICPSIRFPLGLKLSDLIFIMSYGLSIFDELEIRYITSQNNKTKNHSNNKNNNRMNISINVNNKIDEISIIKNILNNYKIIGNLTLKVHTTNQVFYSVISPPFLELYLNKNDSDPYLTLYLYNFQILDVPQTKEEKKLNQFSFFLEYPIKTYHFIARSKISKLYWIEKINWTSKIAEFKQILISNGEKENEMFGFEMNKLEGKLRLLKINSNKLYNFIKFWCTIKNNKICFYSSKKSQNRNESEKDKIIKFVIKLKNILSINAHCDIPLKIIKKIGFTKEEVRSAFKITVKNGKEFVFFAEDIKDKLNWTRGIDILRYQLPEKILSDISNINNYQNRLNYPNGKSDGDTENAFEPKQVIKSYNKKNKNKKSFQKELMWDCIKIGYTQEKIEKILHLNDSMLNSLIQEEPITVIINTIDLLKNNKKILYKVNKKLCVKRTNFDISSLKHNRSFILLSVDRDKLIIIQWNGNKANRLQKAKTKSIVNAMFNEMVENGDSGPIGIINKNKDKNNANNSDSNDSNSNIKSFSFNNRFDQKNSFRNDSLNIKLKRKLTPNLQYELERVKSFENFQIEKTDNNSSLTNENSHVGKNKSESNLKNNDNGNDNDREGNKRNNPNIKKHFLFEKNLNQKKKKKKIN